MTKMKRRVRIGTRGSKLAMWQATHVRELIGERHPGLSVEIVVIKTTGDANQHVAFSELPGKAFFTKEIEEALLDGRADLAVHSGKDVPTEMPEGLALVGFVVRHAPGDALVSRSGATLDALPPGARVGTSSTRRRSLVANLRPDLEILDLRGNVDTRLRKLDEGRYDAILLAVAGLERLGLGDRITERLDTRRFPPAVSQGAMALQVRAGDGELIALMEEITDDETTAAVTAERALLAELEGGCQVPLGALATVGGGEVTMLASLVAPDGTVRVDGEIVAPVSDAVRAGRELAERLLSQGGDAVMRVVRG
jgi:hydroxymethylbilane synthase